MNSFLWIGLCNNEPWLARVFFSFYINCMVRKYRLGTPRHKHCVLYVMVMSIDHLSTGWQFQKKCCVGNLLLDPNAYYRNKLVIWRRIMFFYIVPLYCLDLEIMLKQDFLTSKLMTFIWKLGFWRQRNKMVSALSDHFISFLVQLSKQGWHCCVKIGSMSLGHNKIILKKIVNISKNRWQLSGGWGSWITKVSCQTDEWIVKHAPTPHVCFSNEAWERARKNKKEK